ncbi:MAG: hypothetical protein H6Q90_3944, partial [Deltaproteobacteria bacterium]|nr:hypothetical protein [Deltaproteobacteria bacterium]
TIPTGPPPPPRLTRVQHDALAALRTMGYLATEDDVRHSDAPNVRWWMRGPRRATTIWLPGVDEWAYYTGDAFADSARAVVGDLGIASSVEVADDHVVLVLDRERTEITERPRATVLAALSAALARKRPDLALWFDDDHVAWRGDANQVALWREHAGLVLSRDVPPEPAGGPPPRLKRVLPRVRWLPDLPELAEVDSDHDPDADLDMWFQPITAWLARAGVRKTRCFVDGNATDYEDFIGVEARGTVHQIGPFTEGEIEPEDLARCLARVIAPDEDCLAFHDPWNAQDGWLLVTPEERECLSAVGLLSENRQSDRRSS